MRREDVAPGKTVVIEGEPGDRFYVVLAGMLEVTQAGRGTRTLLRPGDYFGEVSLAMDVPRTASVRAVTPATVASCDRATFDEYVRPVFADTLTGRFGQHRVGELGPHASPRRSSRRSRGR